MIKTSVQDIVDGTGISRYLVTKALNQAGVTIGTGKGKTLLEAKQVSKIESSLKVDLHKAIRKAEITANKPKAAKPKAAKPKAAKPKAAKPAAKTAMASKPKATKPTASKPKAVESKKPHVKAAHDSVAKQPLKPKAVTPVAATALQDTDGVH